MLTTTLVGPDGTVGSFRGCLSGAPDFDLAIEGWKRFREFMLELLNGDWKYVLSTNNIYHGTGWSSRYPIAWISGGWMKSLGRSADLGWEGAGGYNTCVYSNLHYVYPSGAKGRGGASTPWTGSVSINSVADDLHEKHGIPYAALGFYPDNMSKSTEFDLYLGRPHDLVTRAGEVIKCLEQAKKNYLAQEAKKKPATLPPTYATERIPSTKPWYKTWKVLIPIGGLAAAATGAAIIIKRR
jgi:hypothetical protein